MSQPKPLMPDVSVNGVAISAADIAAEAQNHNAPKGKPGWAWKSGAKALVIRELLMQEAHARSLQPAPKELEPGKVETPDESLIRLLLELAVTPDTPAEDEVAKVYAKHPDLFRAPTLYEPTHILFAADPSNNDAREAAFKKAEAALVTLTKQPGGFGALAREISDCPSKENHGQLGQMVSGDTVPEFERAMDALEPGQLCPAPVPTRYGIHILRLDAKAVGEVLPFEAVKTQIIEMVEKANWAKAANAFVATLVAKAKISGVDIAA
ncbi:MAG: peptidyl-prolyl cis-trans isomerase [Rhodobacteraceae bacterium]|nr:peptidyl-prolyl cis-trans isomerase [Paracoccaceae bacterium]